MSEDDRAAKAARAKAMLKRRQKERAGGPSHPGLESPASSLMTLTPVPQETFPHDKHDLADVFNKNDTSDMSWLSSLPRAASAPSHQPVISLPQSSMVTFPSASETLSKETEVLRMENASLQSEMERLQTLEPKLKTAEELLEEQYLKFAQLQKQFHQSELERDSALKNERRTISLLVEEKSTLMADLQRLQAVDSEFHALEKELVQERKKLKSLEQEFGQVQIDAQRSAKTLQESRTKEKELTERLREKERELQLARSSATNFKQEAEQHERELRELEEQMQNDDRIERLEESLKNTQERADELDFQLAKLKQVHASLKAEHDEVEIRQHQTLTSHKELNAKHAELQALHATTLQGLTITESERDDLAQEKSDLQNQAALAKKALAELQERLSQADATITLSSRQLRAAQNELKSAIRRAEDAEKLQQNLQAEGTTLMRSLDEMRPKIVELTGIKLELTEKVSALTFELKQTREVVTQLEVELHGLHEQNGMIEKELRELNLEREKERKQTLANSSDFQKAYDELKEELESANVSLRNLEAERSRHHQDLARKFEEIEHLTSVFRTRSEEASTLRKELNLMTETQNESQEYLEVAQNEIEELRADLGTRDAEIEHLRKMAVFPASKDGPQSLDDELLSSIRQQHALELSTAQSQIRALETSVFEANTQLHALQKQKSALEAQLAQSRSRPASRLGQQSFSSSYRPPSRGYGHSSIVSHHHALPPLARSILEQNMSAETRHKRLVSLGMLKARIDSEVEVTLTRPSSRASSVRGLSPVRSESGSTHSHIPHRPQFLDDSHVFWCHSCRGDLVIL